MAESVSLLGDDELASSWEEDAIPMSSLDELVSLWREDEIPNVPECTMREALDFALTATEKEVKFIECNANGIRQGVGLLAKDVIQGLLVVRLLGDEMHSTVRWQTTKCLADIAVSHEMQVTIASLAGVLQALVGLLTNASEGRVLEEASRCISQLAVARENRVKVASCPGVLGTLVTLLANSKSVGVLEQTANCLANLSESREIQLQIASYPGAINAMVAVLRKSWSLEVCEVCEHTARCVSNLAGQKENRAKIISYPGVLDALVRLLGTKGTTSATVRTQSAKCLTTLASHYGENKVHIASHPGVLDAIVRLLKYNWITTGRIMVQVEAARCLISLASAHQNVVRIAFHDGALDALVNCLGECTVGRVQDLAAECLRDLAVVPENQRKIATHPGALTALVRMSIQVVNPSRQTVAVSCLSRLAVAQEANVVLVAHPGVLDSLVRLLGKDSCSPTVEPAIRCIASLALLPDTQAKIASQTGAIAALVKLLEEYEFVDTCVLEQTTICLSLLAQAAENQAKIVAYPGALDALVNLLVNARSTVVLERVVKCLTNLAEVQENQKIIAAFPGILNALVKLLSKNVIYSVQEEILQCLAKLSESQENQVKIRVEITSYPSAHDVLTRLTARNASSWSALKQAFRCLENLNLHSFAEKYEEYGFDGQPITLQRRRLRERATLVCNPDAIFVDPLTEDIMCDPVKCSDGRTYDRWTIIDHRIVECPYDRTLSTFTIISDDVDVRARLFLAFPQQEAKLRSRRKMFREEALKHADEGEFEDAVEKLNSVLKWDPSDEQCVSELERVLEQSIDPDRWDMDPITYDRMCDPVKCNDGRTYDRWTLLDNNMTRCPYDAGLKSFGIVVDDLNVRRRLFEKFPEQEEKFRVRRMKYREEALLQTRGEYVHAIKKLRNVLAWAPTDRSCRLELKRSLNRLREQNSKMSILRHEDLIRAERQDKIARLAVSIPIVLFFAAITLVIESCWFAGKYSGCSCDSCWFAVSILVVHVSRVGSETKTSHLQGFGLLTRLCSFRPPNKIQFLEWAQYFDSRKIIVDCV